MLLWWGHMAHGDVADATVDRVQERVLNGMGLIVLHSGHFSKPFRRLMGTSCSLRAKRASMSVWVVKPSHPIAQGVGPYFEVPQVEMYGEHFDIPTRTIWSSSVGSRAATSSAAAAASSRPRQDLLLPPGHETHPIYYQGDPPGACQRGAGPCAAVSFENPYGMQKAINEKQALEPIQ